MSSLKKKCVSCEKFINIGQCITECAKCLNVIHSRCFSKSNFKQANEKYYCEICHSLILLRYNPFKKLNDEINSDSEQTFNENPCSYTGDLTEASQVLDKCENFEFKYVTELLNDNQNNFNSYFYNIDGNKSNFNVFAAELKNLQANFSIIGISETNVNSDQRDLYPLQDYNSFYSDKLKGKKSGTGIALYIHEKFNAIKKCCCFNNSAIP